MQPLNNARQLAWRAMLSALAGGGLTTAALGGPVSAALAEGGGVPDVTVSESSGTETTATQPAQPPTSTQSETQTSTQPAPAPAASEPPSSTTTFAAPPPPAAKGSPEAGNPSTVVLKRKKTAKRSKPSAQQNSTAAAKALGANNVALPPALVAGQAKAIAAALASSSASVQALGFYRIPLFLLPIYKSAAVQYGVPWQILAAINEIETDYGTDQSVSSAGAVGWMQFMPETWLQYGVDALNAGYADPYNPVDAIFAAARYLRAAGAATNLTAAIYSYNHSQEYVASVLLRAKLISAYPKAVIATLTGLTDGRLPVSGAHLAWNTLLPTPASPASATANAAPAPAQAAGEASAPHGEAAPAPAVSATAATAGANGKRAHSAAAPRQFVEVTSTPRASVVAVQDGRIAQIGHSAHLGSFIVLRDVYGDLFTYAGLGSIAKTYMPGRSPRGAVKSPAIEAASTTDPTPSKPATAGRQPLTLNVKPPAQASADAAASAAQALSARVTGYQQTSTPGKVRLFARPGNPDARAAAASAQRAAKRASTAGRSSALKPGAVVVSGTVLGKVQVPAGAHAGHMRFAIRPAGDSATVDPRPILTNWAQLALALHPQGAKGGNALLGANAGDVLLMSRAELERAVLSDPNITLDACARHEIASGRLDRRVLAVLSYLSHSGLKPTAGALECSAAGASLSAGAAARAAAQIDITSINGVAIAGHQGAGTITDLAIRTLLTLPEQFAPHTIASLMRYPGARNTHAAPAYWNRIRVSFQPAAHAPAAHAGSAAHAHSALAPSPLTSTFVSATQWQQLMGRVGALPVPAVRTTRSPAAVPDPKHRQR